VCDTGRAVFLLLLFLFEHGRPEATRLSTVKGPKVTYRPDTFGRVRRSGHLRDRPVRDAQARWRHPL